MFTLIVHGFDGLIKDNDLRLEFFYDFLEFGLIVGDTVLDSNQVVEVHW